MMRRLRQLRNKPTSSIEEDILLQLALHRAHRTMLLPAFQQSTTQTSPSPSQDSWPLSVPSSLPQDGSDKNKAPPILPANERRAQLVQELRNHWTCAGHHRSAYCYVDPDTGVHLSLNQSRLECWASAMLKGDDSATLENPPNHRLFDSPVRQRQLGAQNPRASGSSIPLSSNSIDIIRSIFHTTASPPQVLPAPIQALVASLNATNMLLNPARDPGPDMPITLFCQSFDIPETVHQKLRRNAYGHARLLRFITLDLLATMDFLPGEIAALQDAVERWSVSRHPVL